MTRSHIVLLAALSVAASLALAEDRQVQPQQPSDPLSIQTDPPGDDSDVRETMSAIRTEVIIADQLASEFEIFAGSHQNAQNLVIGLRNAKPVKMTAAAAPNIEVSFTPPTRPMSFSDIHNALLLAMAQLQSKHINSPTPAQVKASLAGGELPNADGDMTRVIGILPLHRRGMGWEEIARALRVAMPRRMAAIRNPQAEM